MTSTTFPLSTISVIPFWKDTKFVRLNLPLEMLCFCWHSFQDNLLYDPVRHGGESDSPGVPFVFLLYFLKIRLIFPLPQSMATSLDYHDFSNMMDSALATLSTRCLRICPWISLGLIHLCPFRYLRWSWTWSFATSDSPFGCIEWITYRAISF